MPLLRSCEHKLATTRLDKVAGWIPIAEWSVHRLLLCSPPSFHSSKKNKKTCMCGDLETQIVHRCECECERSELSLHVALDTYCRCRQRFERKWINTDLTIKFSVLSGELLWSA